MQNTKQSGFRTKQIRRPGLWQASESKETKFMQYDFETEVACAPSVQTRSAL